MPPRRPASASTPRIAWAAIAVGAMSAAAMVAWGVREVLQVPAEGTPTTTESRTNSAPNPPAETTLPPRGTAAPGVPNLLLITLCSVRADRVGAWGAASAKTPALDALAAEGVRFENAWSPATFTLPSHAAMLTGRLPGHAGVLASDDVLPAAATTLPEVLRLYGYTTFAWAPVASRASFRSGDGLEQGFDHFADGGFGDLDDLLGDVATPWFALVHFKEAHRPYNMDFDKVAPVFRAWDTMVRTPGSGNADALLAEGLKDPAVHAQLDAAYDAALSRVDQSVEGVIASLKARGAWENTVIVVVGDHGESLGEHDFVGHQGRLYPEVLHVPMIVHGAGTGVVPDDVSLVDVMPTLLDLAKGVAPTGMDGRSLLPLLSGRSLPPRPAIAQSEPRPGGPRNVASVLISGKDWLLHDTQDTLLQRDAAGAWVAATDPDRAAALRAALDAATSDAQDPTRRPLDPEEKAALQQGGYW